MNKEVEIRCKRVKLILIECLQYKVIKKLKLKTCVRCDNMQYFHSHKILDRIEIYDHLNHLLYIYFFDKFSFQFQGPIVHAGTNQIRVKQKGKKVWMLKKLYLLSRSQKSKMVLTKWGKWVPGKLFVINKALCKLMTIVLKFWGFVSWNRRTKWSQAKQYIVFEVGYHHF